MFSGLKSRWIMLCEWMNWQALMIYQIIFLAYSNLNKMMSKFELPRGALSPCCHCGLRAPPGSSCSAAQTRGKSSRPPWKPLSDWQFGHASATSRFVSPLRQFSSPITRCWWWLYLNKRLWNKILKYYYYSWGFDLTYSLSSLSLNFLMATSIPLSICHAIDTIPYVLYKEDRQAG